jgi:molecular chaperone GrpE
MEAETHFDNNGPAGATASAGMPESHAGDSELTAQLEAEKKRADENHQKALYALAELDNYRKRAERQVSERITAGKKATLLKFLPVIDNLERALSVQIDAPGLRGGLEATLRGFEGVLTSEGVKPFDVLNLPFDPRNSEAVGTRDAGDAVADDTVVDVAVRGYMLGDELLRPAQVIVSKRAE